MGVNMLRRNFLKMIPFVAVVGTSNAHCPPPIFVANTIYDWPTDQYRTLIMPVNSIEDGNKAIQMQTRIQNFTLIDWQTNLDSTKVHCIKHNTIDNWKEQV